jgi:hypothetical protein
MCDSWPESPCLAARLSGCRAVPLPKFSQPGFPQTLRRHTGSSLFNISFAPSDFNVKGFNAKLKAPIGNGCWRTGTKSRNKLPCEILDFRY